jgi:hypothetical protein
MVINYCGSFALLKAAGLNMKVSTERFICAIDLNMVQYLTKGHGKSFKEILYGGLEWSYLAAVPDQWWNAGNEVVRLGFALNVENLAATSRSERILQARNARNVGHNLL